MTAPGYRHLVETDGPGRSVRLYDGEDAADAVAAWSKAISDGADYVTLESLKSTRQTYAEAHAFDGGPV